MKTKCQVRYVVESPDDICKEEKISKKGRRRWLVFFDETDYITCDFVVLSGMVTLPSCRIFGQQHAIQFLKLIIQHFAGGVLGTAEILFQSQMRGLKLSERLGYGFSCNGNNVAYLAGSPAPLNAYGLDKKKFSKIPFQERPGPSISSSYTSSLGFTIQVNAYSLFCFFENSTTIAFVPCDNVK